MKKITIPAPDVPPLLEGKPWDPVWYEKIKQIVDAINAGVLGGIDVDNSTPITNGQVLVYNSTTKKLTPGSN